MKHTFSVGQLVWLKGNDPGRRSGHAYCIVHVLPQEGDGIPTYRIKNAAGVELIVRQNAMEAASAEALPC